MPAPIPSLYNAILNMCADPGNMCMSEMMAMDSGHDLPCSGKLA